MTDVYVQRDGASAIIGVCRAPQPGIAEEAISADDPAVLAFLSKTTLAPRDLAAEIDSLKAKLARAEAAEAVLVEKGTITAAEIDAKVPDVLEVPVGPGKGAGVVGQPG